MFIQKHLKKSVSIWLLGLLAVLFAASCSGSDSALETQEQQTVASITGLDDSTTEPSNEVESSTTIETSSDSKDMTDEQRSNLLANVSPQSSESSKPGMQSDESKRASAGSESTPSSKVPQQANSAALQWGTDASKPSNGWSKPAVGSVYKDPSYGTSVRRISDAGSDRFNRNTYSRRQAENADGTMFLTYHGSAAYHVYSVATNKLVNKLEVHPNGEPQWHPTDPSIVRHISGGNSYVGSLKLYETDVETGATKTIADLTSRVKAKIPSALYMQDRAEGSPSEDGNRYAWMVYNSAEKPIGVVTYDLTTDSVLAVTSAIDTSRFDWVSMSPSGKYVVASETNGTYVFDADLSSKRLLTEAIEHSDIGYDKNGRETYVYIDFNSASETAGWLTAVDLQTLERTKIFDIYDNANSSVHVSMKGYDKPGWALISTYNCKVPGAWTCDKVFAVEIAPNGRILNLAHTYNCGDNYWTETHAVVNRSFTRVYYNSDGGSCGIDAEAYRLDVPSFE